MNPICMYLLKVTEFCNLNCPYCYIFNLKDSSFQGKPRVMPLDLVEIAASKMMGLAREQCVEELTISLHGGEPMLAGMNWFREALSILRRAADGQVKLKFFMQTNGVLVDKRWADLFEELGIQVGLSMDGPPEVHNRYRIDFAGRGTYEATVRALRLLQPRKGVFTGILCVIDPTADGLTTYRHFRDLGVERIDFLWPLDHNWNTPPPGLENSTVTPYADYLIPIFDDWWREDNKTVRIRYFDHILLNLFGAQDGIDSLGGNPISITTIDSDGSLEPVDSLRACGDGFTNLGLNIRRHSISALYEAQLFKTALAGRDNLCEICRACPFHDVCGAGYLPHRYSHARGFANPSVYCRDLWKLISHILDAAVEKMEVWKPGTLPPGAWQEEAALAFGV